MWNDFSGYLKLSSADFRFKHLDRFHGFSANSDFMLALYKGSEKLLYSLNLQMDKEIADKFEGTLLALKKYQFQTILERTQGVPLNFKGYLAALLILGFFAYIFFKYLELEFGIASKELGVVTAIVTSLIGIIGVNLGWKYNREAKPDFLLKNETNYKENQEAALDRIYSCVRLQPVKVRYLERNTNITILKASPQKTQKTDMFVQTEIPADETRANSRAKNEKSPADKHKKFPVRVISTHKRLHSFDWSNQNLPRFSTNNTSDPTRPFAVNIKGIPYGRAFCMFPAAVVEKLKEQGINNLMEVASQSGSCQGDQGIVKAKNAYQTEEGIFDAVAKLKFIGSRKSEKSKGCVRVYMREGAKGPDGESLLIGDGLQTDHQYSS